MKVIICIALFSFCGLFLNAQSSDFEVEGKMLVKDINTIATFQSSSKNSFIKMATNDNPLDGTTIGYFHDSLRLRSNYFYIDVPNEDFGELIIDDIGRVAIGTTLHEAKLTVIGEHNFMTIYGVNRSENGIGVRGTTSGAGGTGVMGYSLVPDGTAVEGFAQSSGCDFDATGPGTNYCSTSSKRWKSNIKNITEPIDKLTKLRGVTFTWDKEHGGKHDIGFIAEEVGRILPEIVVYEANEVDASGMDYSQMTPLLVEATKAMREEYQDKFEEQQTEIESLKQEMRELKMLINRKFQIDSED